MPKYVKKRILTLRKSLTAKQEKGFNEFSKDFGKFKILKTLDLARIFRPDIFPYSKQNRLFRDAKKGIIDHLNEIEVLYSRLNQKQQKEILNHVQFYRTLNLFMQTAENLQAKPIVESKKGKKKIIGYELQKSNAENMSSVILFENFFNIGING